MSFGFSFDLMALRAFFEARLDAMDADPYECEGLAMLGYGVEKVVRLFIAVLGVLPLVLLLQEVGRHVELYWG